MKNKAFTLIELLVTITIIGVIAALTLPVYHSAKRMTTLAVVKSEMASIETAIGGYHRDYGFNPPSGTNSLANPLFIELAGTVNQKKIGYTLLDNPSQSIIIIPTNSINGYVNCTRDGSGEDVPFAKNYLKNLNPKTLNNLYDGFPVLITVVGNSPSIWRYANHGTNNPEAYDLWTQVVINGKTNLVCNWSKQIQINSNYP